MDYEEKKEEELEEGHCCHSSLTPKSMGGQ